MAAKQAALIVAAQAGALLAYLLILFFTTRGSQAFWLPVLGMGVVAWWAAWAVLRGMTDG